jgi:hypothetical protein
MHFYSKSISSEKNKSKIKGGAITAESPPSFLANSNRKRKVPEKWEPPVTKRGRGGKK